MYRLARIARRLGVHTPARAAFRAVGLDRAYHALMVRRVGHGKRRLRRHPWVTNDAGIGLRVNPDDPRAQRLLASGGTLDRGLIQLWDQLCRELDPDLVLDVGANYGEVVFSRAYPPHARLVLFEPVPELCDCLRVTAHVNHMANVEVRAEAASSRAGQQALHLSAIGSGRSSLVAGPEHEGNVVVPTVAIDDVVAPGRVLLAKIDVEGHEPDVLAGMRRLVDAAERAVIVCEIARLDDVRAAAMTEGFEAYAVDRYTLERTRVTAAGWAGFLDERDTDLLLKDVVLVKRPGRHP